MWGILLPFGYDFGTAGAKFGGLEGGEDAGEVLAAALPGGFLCFGG